MSEQRSSHGGAATRGRSGVAMAVVAVGAAVIAALVVRSWLAATDVTYVATASPASFADRYDGYHDFGQVQPDEAGNLMAKFEFTNTSAASVTLGKVRKSCGCTTVSLPESPVKPGTTAQVTLHVDWHDRAGGVAANAKVAVGETGRTLSYFVQAFVEPQTVVDPRGVYFGSLEEGESRKREFSLHIRADAPPGDVTAVLDDNGPANVFTVEALSPPEGERLYPNFITYRFGVTATRPEQLCLTSVRFRSGATELASAAVDLIARPRRFTDADVAPRAPSPSKPATGAMP